MSHGITLFIKPTPNSWDSEEVKKKKEVSEPVLLFEYPGCSNLYSYFRDNGLDHFCGTDEPSYRELTMEDINTLKADINSLIRNVKVRIEACLELKGVSDEVYQDFISNKIYLKELEEDYEDVQFLSLLITNCSWVNNTIVYYTY